MILKTLTYDRGSAECWNYYSGIKNVSVFFKDESTKCIAISGNDFDDEVVLEISGPAYLCDDLGQTIEKVGVRRSEKTGRHPVSVGVGVAR